MIPTATKAVQSLLAPNFSKCESPSLRLEKFVVIADKKFKKDEIGHICACVSRHAIAPVFRLSRLPGALTAIMKLQSRLIINQAGGILENAGICLHPHFGCPMIPGSAVKGIARAAAIQAIRDADSAGKKTDLLVQTALTFGWCEQEWNPKDTRQGTCVSDLRYACGEQFWKSCWTAAAERLLAILQIAERRINRKGPSWESLPNFSGRVSFLPALPIAGTPIKLVPDLVNCHHPEYYQGKREKATDTESPVPNFFPAVEAGLSFEFVVAPVRAMDLPDFTPAAFAMECLKNGLSSRGAGAKTNAGYGWFELDIDAQTKMEEQAKKTVEESKKAQAEAARLAAMSPEEKAAEEYWKTLGNDPVGAFKGKLPQIASLTEQEQRCICWLLAGKCAAEWKADVAEAAKAKGPDDKKGGKAFKRVNAVRPIAKKWGVTLP